MTSLNLNHNPTPNLTLLTLKKIRMMIKSKIKNILAFGDYTNFWELLTALKKRIHEIK